MYKIKYLIKYKDSNQSEFLSLVSYIGGLILKSFIPKICLAWFKKDTINSIRTINWTIAAKMKKK